MNNSRLLFQLLFMIITIFNFFLHNIALYLIHGTIAPPRGQERKLFRKLTNYTMNQ